MKIGELLIEQRKLRASDLSRALAEKPATTRLCSFLIERGLVEFDDGSRALGQQHNIANALVKHLDGRDPGLASVIPAELGRGSCVLPIGRSSKGSLIVCVRDPAPALHAAIVRAVRGDVLVVVTPASRLERLVAEAYGRGAADELDIEFDLAPETAPPLVARTFSPRRITTPAIPVPVVPPPPDMDALDPESIRLSLTDLDDVRVAKDPAQSGQIPKLGRKTATLPPATKPVSRPITTPPPPPSTAALPKKLSLDAMHEGLRQAKSREAATDLVLEYVATRWSAGLVLALRERAAIGYRGYRVIAPESVTVSLGSPSTVQRAVQTRFVSVESPSGVGQSTLTYALGGSCVPAAAPILVGGQPVAVIAVGDPIDGPSARDGAAADLAALAEALGTAYARILTR